MGDPVIRLDLKPEDTLSGGEIRSPEDHEMFMRRIESLRNVKYPFIDVWDFNAALAWMTHSEDGYSFSSERVHKVELKHLGITDEMLVMAVREAGGSLGRSGQYPISEEIREQLKRALNQP